MGGALEATHDDRRSTRAALAWLVALGTLVFALVALVVPARAQVRGTIVGPGATSYPIAVSPLKGADGDRFADIVARDLDLSGFFKVIDRGAYIEHEDPVAARVERGFQPRFARRQGSLEPGAPGDIGDRRHQGAVVRDPEDGGVIPCRGADQNPRVGQRRQGAQHLPKLHRAELAGSTGAVTVLGEPQR